MRGHGEAWGTFAEACPTQAHTPLLQADNSLATSLLYLVLLFGAAGAMVFVSYRLGHQVRGARRRSWNRSGWGEAGGSGAGSRAGDGSGGAVDTVTCAARRAVPESSDGGSAALRR